MRLKDLTREIDDLLLTIVRSGSVRDGVRVFDPLPLAAAWLAGEEGAWQWRNRGLVSDEEMPEARLARGKSPFESGYCLTRHGRTTVLQIAPAYMSPATERQQTGSATAMPSFGPLGGHRFTNEIAGKPRPSGRGGTAA